MSTVAEIEAAIEKLPYEELGELPSWMDEHRAALGTVESLFAVYDEEEAHAAGQTG